ncbi:MAG: HAMP domain-containing histidine kinase [Clostridium sp.]|nr:HAMP domain-containing histidine kinase [Clostridium sp.]
MDIKSKSSHKWGVLIIILAVIGAAAATVGLYPYMTNKANEYEAYNTSRIREQNRDYSNLSTQVMNFSYVLWHQQMQEEAGRIMTYSEAYLPGLEEKISELQGERESHIAQDGPAEAESDYESYDDYLDFEGYGEGYGSYSYNLDYWNSLRNIINSAGEEWEGFYRQYTPYLFYRVVGKDGETLRSNVNRPEEFFDAPLSSQEREFMFTVEFSSTGSTKVTDFTGDDDDASRFLQAMNRYEFYDPLIYRTGEDYQYSSIRFSTPKDMTIQFRCYPDNVINQSLYSGGRGGLDAWSYLDSSYYPVIGFIIAVLLALALALPAVKSFEIGRSALCRLPFEPLSCIGVGWLAIMGEGSLPASMIAATMKGSLYTELLKAGFLVGSADVMATLINILFWSVLYGFFYWGITCYRAIFSLGPWVYFKRRTWLGQFLCFIKRWLVKSLNVFNETDWESRSTKIIGKAVIANFVILTLISLLWFWGIGALVIYSVVLFILFTKYWGQMQKKYSRLLEGINAMAEGNLDVEIDEDLGIFNPFKEQLARIQAGFKKAVAQEVKSERTKSELITNVSHDLKTPLTAIITYVNLLKQDNITDEERDAYIQVLDQKSMRLKALIEDLFEVSKASSGTVTLHPENVDIISLLKQVRYELADKIEASGIEFRFHLPEERVTLYLDSQKTYRIFENLMVNITKYGMPGTRAYVQVARDQEGYVVITMRNISDKELNISPEELTERFVRGDVSRNTEGSGLGLAIARSFVEVQEGTMDIQLEDDLFRVVIRWKERREEPENLEPEAWTGDADSAEWTLVEDMPVPVKDMPVKADTAVEMPQQTPDESEKGTEEDKTEGN